MSLNAFQHYYDSDSLVMKRSSDQAIPLATKMRPASLTINATTGTHRRRSDLLTAADFRTTQITLPGPTAIVIAIAKLRLIDHHPESLASQRLD